MPRHFLIPYVPMQGHKDPDFHELSYGDSGVRGRRLAREVETGSNLFFHTNIGGSKYITCYISVSEKLEGSKARAMPSIRGDGRFDDWMFLGDPQQSKRIAKPLPLTRALMERLSLSVSFKEEGRTETQVIGSATRAHRLLSEDDAVILRSECMRRGDNGKIENPEAVQKHLFFYDEGEDIIPFDEVHKLRETEVQKLLRKSPEVIEAGAKVLAFEKVLGDGDRLDLLLEASDGSLILAELKGPNKVTDSIPTQLASYAKDIAEMYPGRKLRKMVVCDGKVSPKLQKACVALDIEIVVYGVRLDCFRLHS
jgi:hypothetical protein